MDEGAATPPWQHHPARCRTGEIIEGIEAGNLASKESSAEMRSILLRQQLGTRRIPQYLSVPVGHKTGEVPPFIANDVGIVYAESGPIIISFFTAENTAPWEELEDRMAYVSRLIVDYFDAGE